MNRHKYYTEDLPWDCLSEDATDDDWFQLAILQIKERQRVYRCPANWTLVWRKEGRVRVRYDYREKEK